MPSASEGSNVFTANIVDTGADYIEFQASWVSSSHSFMYERYVKLQINGHGTIIIESNEVGGANSTFYEIVDGLEPNTTYSWKATLGWGDANGGQTYSTWAVVSGTFKTDSLIQIEPWSWSKSNGSASATQTQRAYDILKGNVSVGEGFSYKVWNDLIDKIIEVRDARKDIAVSWDNAYATEAKTRASSGSSLSATRFNSIRYNINNMKGVGDIPYVSSGDRLYGKYITSLVDTLNKIIDEL